MPQAVGFDEYGGIDVPYVAEVERPVPGPGQVLVRVKAAGTNPDEAAIRNGSLDGVWPATNFTSAPSIPQDLVRADGVERGHAVVQQDRHPGVGVGPLRPRSGVVLDLTLPGFEVADRLRSRSGAPILMLSAGGGRGQGQGAEPGRRRLPDQAVRLRGAGGEANPGMRRFRGDEGGGRPDGPPRIPRRDAP